MRIPISLWALTVYFVFVFTMAAVAGDDAVGEFLAPEPEWVVYVHECPALDPCTQGVEHLANVVSAETDARSWEILRIWMSFPDAALQEPAPVPLPASAWYIGSALVLLAMLRRVNGKSRRY